MSNDSPVDDMKLDNVSSISESTINDSILQPDSLSTDIELEDAVDGSLDLREITQSILDLEETQASSSTEDFARLSCQQIPSSPPPSYEHVLAETKLEEEAAALAESSQGEESYHEFPQDTRPPADPRKGVEIMHKSHKEFYRAVAKQWGITCKMSDHCRCLDCQSMYFECEYDQNEQEKTDGGLGAGTPMFISEVMHGSACVLL